MSFQKYPILWFFMLLGFSGLAALLAPLEKTLGSNARLVYFHGAWVWTAMLAFLAASVLGLTALISRSLIFHQWSRALGRTGLVFWVAFLPMSLLVMQVNWNGLFLDEPRFRIPLNYAIVGLLLQTGLTFFPAPPWSSIANIIFGVSFFWGIAQVETILHPDSPIFSSGARDIQVYFLLLFVLLSLSAFFLACGWLQWEKHKNKKR